MKGQRVVAGIDYGGVSSLVTAILFGSASVISAVASAVSANRYRHERRRRHRRRIREREPR